MTTQAWRPKIWEAVAIVVALFVVVFALVVTGRVILLPEAEVQRPAATPTAATIWVGDEVAVELFIDPDRCHYLIARTRGGSAGVSITPRLGPDGEPWCGERP